MSRFYVMYGMTLAEGGCPSARAGCSRSRKALPGSVLDEACGAARATVARGRDEWRQLSSSGTPFAKLML